MTNLLETKMAEAESQVKTQRLRKLLRDAQDLMRKNNERINGLRFTLRERTREVANLRESLAAQEGLMSQDLKSARDKIEKLEQKWEQQSNTVAALTSEIRMLKSDNILLDTECDRKAEQIYDLQRQLDRIPRWVRRIFRASHSSSRPDPCEDHDSGGGSWS